MKIKFFVTILCVMFLFNFSAYAAVEQYSITVDETFTYVKKGEDLTKMAQQLNITTDELSKLFSDETGLVYLATSPDNSSQIRVTVLNDELSDVFGDISNLNDTELEDFSNSLDDNGVIIQNKDRKFIMIKNNFSENDIPYTATQYITIFDGKTYCLTCYNKGSDTTKEIQQIFESFSLNYSEIDRDDFSKEKAWIIVGISLLSVLIVSVTVSILTTLSKQCKIK